MFLKNLARDRKGGALVEYALLIAGVALVAAAAVSIFGHKTSDMVGAVATVLPGAHGDDNGPIGSGKVIETTPADPNTPIAVDITTISDPTTIGTGRLSQNLFGDPNSLESLVQEFE